MADELIVEVTGDRAEPSQGYHDPDDVLDARMALRSLCQALCPDSGRPVLRGWVADRSGLRLHEVALRPEGSTTQWAWRGTAQAEHLRADVGGATLTAVRQRGSEWEVLLDGRQMVRTGAARWCCQQTGRLLGCAHPVTVVHDATAWLEIGPDRWEVSLGGVGFGGGGDLPEEARLTAAVRDGGSRLDLGAGSVDGGRWRWRGPVGRSAPGPGELVVETNLRFQGSAQGWRVALVPRTDFSQVQVPAPAGGSALIRDPSGISKLSFSTATPVRAPGRIRLSARWLEGDEPPQERLARRVGSDSERVAYRLDAPLTSPRTLPARLRIELPGQSDPAGDLTLIPGALAGRWRRHPEDLRAIPQAPQLDPRFMELGSGGAAWELLGPGRVRQRVGDITFEVPLDDSDFQLITLSPSGRPLWSGAEVSAEPGTELVVWVPGQLSVRCGIDAQGSLPLRHDNLRELAFTEARGADRPLRISGRDRLTGAALRGVIWPAVRERLPERWRDPATWQELPSPRGRVALGGQEGRALLVAFRGLLLPAELNRVGDALMLMLERPLPCDGRLGLDVGPFLPLRLSPDGGDRIHAQADGVRGALNRRLGVWTGTAEEPLQYLWTGRGFRPQRPRAARDSGRYAWRGLVWSAEDEGLMFLGWYLEGGVFTSPAGGRLSAYSLSSGATEGEWLQVLRADETDPVFPTLPLAVQHAVEEILAGSGPDDQRVETPQGVFEMARSWDDPDQPPLVEIDPPHTATQDQVRVFALDG